MTKEDIISWAREAECEETFGMDVFRFTLPDLERFANLVAAAQKEADAKLCEDNGLFQTCKAIRARSQA